MLHDVLAEKSKLKKTKQLNSLYCIITWSFHPSLHFHNVKSFLQKNSHAVDVVLGITEEYYSIIGGNS